jgi:hypothetical protein
MSQINSNNLQNLEFPCYLCSLVMLNFNSSYFYVNSVLLSLYLTYRNSYYVSIKSELT